MPPRMASHFARGACATRAAQRLYSLLVVSWLYLDTATLNIRQRYRLSKRPLDENSALCGSASGWRVVGQTCGVCGVGWSRHLMKNGWLSLRCHQYGHMMVPTLTRAWTVSWAGRFDRGWGSQFGRSVFDGHASGYARLFLTQSFYLLKHFSSEPVSI